MQGLGSGGFHKCLPTLPPGIGRFVFLRFEKWCGHFVWGLGRELARGARSFFVGEGEEDAELKSDEGTARVRGFWIARLWHLRVGVELGG